MKILLRILGIIAVIIAAGAYAGTTYRSFLDGKKAPTADEITAFKAEGEKELALMQSAAKEMDAFEKSSNDMAIEELQGKLNEEYTSKTMYTVVGVLGGILVVVSLALGVFLFIPKPKAATILLGLTVVLAGITIALAPSYEGMFSPAAIQKIAITGAVPAVLAALFVFILARKGAKPQLA